MMMGIRKVCVCKNIKGVSWDKILEGGKKKKKEHEEIGLLLCLLWF